MATSIRFIHLLCGALFAALLLLGSGQAAHAAPPAQQAAPQATIYQVQRGDTLSAIARRFGLSVQAIIQANGLRDTAIFAGQRLIIPVAAPATFPTVPTEVYEIMTMRPTNQRSGPGVNYPVYGLVRVGEVIRVHALSSDRQWWQVDCFFPHVQGTCWMRASADLTQPLGPVGTDHIPALPTPVRVIYALTDVNIRSGPALGFAIVERLHAGQFADVLGVSHDGSWWAVPCPGSGVQRCWVSAKPYLTIPANP